MHKLNLSKVIDSVRVTLAKRSPEILTGIGIAGMLTTTVMAVKATPKALRILDEEREYRRIDRENGVDECFAPEKISKKDVIKLCWKCYIPAAVTGTVSVACLIGASSVNVKRNAALATAYTLSETALKEYREKVVETIGEKKEQAVRDAIAKDKLEQKPATANQVIVTDRGNTRCFDAISGRRFTSDIDKLNKIANELNRRMLNEGYISLNEFYDEVGLPFLDIGDELGWRTDRGLIELQFSSQLDTDGTPCLVVGFDIAPKHNYSSAF